MKRFGPIAAVVLVFLVAAFTLVKVYDKGKDSDRLVDTKIPQETIDWINNIGNELNDIISWFNPNPDPTPWGNDDDEGRDSTLHMKVLEDELFVVYYSESLEKRAKECLTHAHESIPRLAEICGKYYYPEDMHGRKVVFYLAKNQREYSNILERKFKIKGRSNTDRKSVV